jgi:hypothetical protein
MTYLSRISVHDALDYLRWETNFGMTQGLFITGRAGSTNRRRKHHEQTY